MVSVEKPLGSALGVASGLLKGRYRVGTMLGEGAMGVVYRGIDEQSSTPVAIKTLQPTAFHSPKAHERFQREASLANKLHHPGIARTLDFGVEGETPFLIMELVEGIELAEIIEQEAPLPPARALDIAIQLTEALAEAHHHNLIHRDIKPANIRLMHYVADGPIQLKVLDFGIAKEIGQEKGQLTTTGAIMGTPLYLAPELLSETHSEIDGRIDQYSAGVVLYQLLAGCPPFAGQNVAAILLSHVTTPPPPLPKTVPEALQRVVLRMLKKTAKERFPNDEALLIALKECGPACRSAQTARRGAIRPSSASLIISLPIQTQRRQNALFGLLLGVLVVGMAVLAVLIQRRPNSQATQASPATSTEKVAVPSSVSSHTPVLAEDPSPSPRSGPTAAIDRELAKSLPSSSTEIRKDAALKKPKQRVRSGQRIEQKEDPRTITFYSALSDPQSKPSDAASYHILGLPLRAGYDVKELASGDVDGDGLPDIFLSGSRMQGTGGFLAVLHNRGRLDQGSFFDDPEYYDFGGGSGESVVVGDWNKDGKLDAAVTSKTQSKIVVFYQQSTTIGQRFRQEIAPGGERPDFITKGDLDQDGFVDLITGVANDINGKSVFLIYNLGSSFDMSPPDYFQGAPIFLSDLHYTDISRDGKSDFTLLYSRSIPMGTELKTIGAVQSFVGQPDGSLLGTGENLIQGIGGRAAIGDIDGNGTQDVVSAGPYQPEAQAATNQFSVLLNDGTGKYQKPYTAIDTIPQPYNVALGDFNLDGKLDVVIANVNALDNGRIAIHLNQGSGVLASQNVPDFFTDVGYSTDIEVTDVNLDGKPDLVVLSSGTPGTQKATRLQVLINTTRR